MAACSTSFVVDCLHREGTEVMKVMTNKLLDPTLTPEAARHGMQSAARPTYTTPYKGMARTASQSWQAGSQQTTEEWTRAMTLLFIAADLCW